MLFAFLMSGLWFMVWFRRETLKMFSLGTMKHLGGVYVTGNMNRIYLLTYVLVHGIINHFSL